MSNTERKLNSIGKRTFVNCYEYFFNNHNKVSDEIAKNISTYDPESSSNSDSSLVMKANYAKQIFKNKLEKECLQICTKANKLEYQLRRKAEELIKLYS